MRPRSRGEAASSRSQAQRRRDADRSRADDDNVPALLHFSSFARRLRTGSLYRRAAELTADPGYAKRVASRRGAC
jgi:hypothetical protein